MKSSHGAKLKITTKIGKIKIVSENEISKMKYYPGKNGN